ncbi:MAG: 3'(2'),5'-bisphosphate nucleotidase CysQ [Deltaproteobacteria bacterium]|nr:3'(2'),5'-bisphosphate nucleotidase CysQ [Deltaproteobacteria bacterium]
MPTFEAEADLACRLAFQAGALILRHRRSNLEVEMKPGNEPVTIADRKASRIIVEGLGAAFPGDAIVSEEEPADLDRLAASERAWFVDPLDGTREFVRGLDTFSVMIGLSSNGRPQLGVVYQPSRERLYVAVAGTPAVRIDRGERRELRCSSVSEPALARLVVSETDRRPEIDGLKRRMGICDETASGSVGLKLGLIAAGERDLYVNPTGNAKAWDTCAGTALLESAGGRITDLDGRDLCYRGPDLWHRRGILASANDRIHEAALRSVEGLWSTRTSLPSTPDGRSTGQPGPATGIGSAIRAEDR